MTEQTNRGIKTKPRKHLSRRSVRAIIALIGSIVALMVASPQNAQKLVNLTGATAPGSWYVSHATDGDTIEVEQAGHKETVRLIGVDTPETKDPRKSVQCFGKAASDHTRQLAEGKTIRMEADPNDSDRDKYKRLLRYVYLPDGTLLNSELIKDGYGFAYVVFPFTKIDEFRGLERAARSQNLGLWAGCQINESTQIKQTQNQ